MGYTPQTHSGAVNETVNGAAAENQPVNEPVHKEILPDQPVNEPIHEPEIPLTDETQLNNGGEKPVNGQETGQESVNESVNEQTTQQQPVNEKKGGKTRKARRDARINELKTSINERKAVKKWHTWAVNVNSEENQLLEKLYHEFVHENPGASKSDFVRERLLTSAVRVVKTANKIPDHPRLEPVLEALRQRMRGLNKLLTSVKPVVDARVQSGITNDELHFITQCIDFAINYNRIGSKRAGMIFAVPKHTIDIPDGFYK